MGEYRQQDVELIRSVRNQLELCLLGKQTEIELLLTALLAGGHVLLEDVPGTGKTVIIKALAKSIQGTYRRIQCNPDLLPSDITGVSIYHPKEERFIYRQGPIMSHIVLADEINRATTKTQSALLEAMEERSVTVDGESHLLPQTFMMMATQNPIEFEGTYILPEAQLDRFMLKFGLGYPSEEDELRMVITQYNGHPVDRLHSIVTVDDIARMQRQVRELHMDEAVAHYCVMLSRLTRDHSAVLLGASPRATLALIQASKANAWLNNRAYVIPDDVKKLLPYVLGHRILLKDEARMDGVTVEQVLKSVIEQVQAPIRLEQGAGQRI